MLKPEVLFSRNARRFIFKAQFGGGPVPYSQAINRDLVKSVGLKLD